MLNISECTAEDEVRNVDKSQVMTVLCVMLYPESCGRLLNHLEEWHTQISLQTENPERGSGGSDQQQRD